MYMLVNTDEFCVDCTSTQWINIDFILSQLGDFFSITEDEVAGYEAPSTITELHTHLKSVTLEYKYDL